MVVVVVVVVSSSSVSGYCPDGWVGGFERDIPPPEASLARLTLALLLAWRQTHSLLQPVLAGTVVVVAWAWRVAPTESPPWLD